MRLGFVRADYMTSSETPVYPGSNLSSGLSGIDYMSLVSTGSDALMQAYPHAFRNPVVVSDVKATVHTGGIQLGYMRPGYGVVPSTEVLANAQASVVQAPLASGYSATPGSVSYPQGGYLEDSQGHALAHTYGAGYTPQPQYTAPSLEAEYQNIQNVAPAQTSQLSSYALPYTGTQEGGLESQQNAWWQQLSADQQQQQPQQWQPQQWQPQQWQQQYQSVGQYSATASAPIKRSNFQRPFQLFPKKKPKLPPVPGSLGPGWCAVCRLDCNSAIVLQTHVTGRKHKRKLELATEEAKIHNEKISTSEKPKQTVGTDERNGALSLNNAIGPRTLNDAKVDGPSGEPLPKRPNLFLEMGIIKEPCPVPKLPLLNEKCEICNVACNSKSVLEAHFRGRKHAAKLSKFKEGVLGNTLSSAVLGNLGGGT